MSLNKIIAINILSKLNELYSITSHEKVRGGDVFYFNTEKHEYKVKITPYQGEQGYFSVGFGVIEDEYLDYNTDIIVNENPFSVMDTVIEIMKSFSIDNDVLGFIFSFRGNKNKNAQRLSLYQRSIKKHFPNADLDLKDGIYYVRLEQNLNENSRSKLILNDQYFISRVPFFKDFENNSGGEQVTFNHFKNWKKDNPATLYFGKNSVTFPYLSVETIFSYFTSETRDFESDDNSKIIVTHNFIYKTEIQMKLPESGEAPNQIASLMFKEIIKDNLSFQESFKVREGEEMPEQKLDLIFNTINKNLFKIEETLDKMNVSYFD